MTASGRFLGASAIPTLALSATRCAYAPNAGWRVEEGRKLIRTYRVPDFNAAVAFVEAIAPVIDAEGHHPILTVAWGKVRVALWTHAIDALTDNDFILAAKFDQVYQQRPGAN